jgi:hypothetical protein
MYVGYVFLCNAASLQQCVKRKLFNCASETVKVAEEVGVDSVVFLLNTDSNTLVGPFTAVGSAKTPLQPGTWTDRVDRRSLSSNIKVEWEDLHTMKNPQDKFPFLKDIKVCQLSHFQTQELLNALKQQPLLKSGR